MTDATSAEGPAGIIGAVESTLRKRGIQTWALTGALALGVWTRPRATADVDICAVIPEAAIDPLLALHDGMRVGPERIPAIVRIRLLGWDVDLFSATSEYDLACLQRAVTVPMGGINVRVVTPEDLILHKLRKLKDDKRKLLQDAADLKALAEARADALDSAWLSKWLTGDDAEKAARLRTLTDAELVAWLSQRS